MGRKRCQWRSGTFRVCHPYVPYTLYPKPGSSSQILATCCRPFCGPLCGHISCTTDNFYKVILNMRTSRSLRAVFTLCLALSWSLVVLAKNAANSWSLVPSSDDSAVTSLSDLKDGVYSIQIAGQRSGCALGSNGPGMPSLAEYVAYACSLRSHPSLCRF